MLCQTFPHLNSRLIRESNGSDLRRRHAALLNKIDGAADQCLGLARSRPGNYRDGRFRGGNRRPLLLVQAVGRVLRNSLGAAALSLIFLAAGIRTRRRGIAWGRTLFMLNGFLHRRRFFLLLAKKAQRAGKQGYLLFVQNFYLSVLPLVSGPNINMPAPEPADAFGNKGPAWRSMSPSGASRRIKSSGPRYGLGRDTFPGP